MKRIIIALVFLLSGCAAYEIVPPEELVIRKEAVLPGMAKGESIDSSIIWLERHLHSKGKIIESADRESGLIVANGTVDYPAAGKLQAIEKVQYKISFTLREEISDSGVAITFTNLLLDVPPRYVRSRFGWYREEFVPGYSVPIRERADLEAARRGALDIADRLVEHLRGVIP